MASGRVGAASGWASRARRRSSPSSTRAPTAVALRSSATSTLKTTRAVAADASASFACPWSTRRPTKGAGRSEAASPVAMAMQKQGQLEFPRLAPRPLSLPGARFEHFFGSPLCVYKGYGVVEVHAFQFCLSVCRSVLAPRPQGGRGYFRTHTRHSPAWCGTCRGTTMSTKVEVERAAASLWPI